jgi:hypothetical protein
MSVSEVWYFLRETCICCIICRKRIQKSTVKNPETEEEVSEEQKVLTEEEEKKRADCLWSGTVVLTKSWGIFDKLDTFKIYPSVGGARGSVVVKAQCYKPEGRGFETGWGKWFLSSYPILPVSQGPGVYSVSNRNEYQKHKNNVSGE